MKQPQIVMVDVSKIDPAPYNPRDITQRALAGLKESLKEFGMPQPLVVNKKTGVLVSGHQRLKAAIALGWKSVPCVMVELSPIQEKALNVTLNNHKISGHFTDQLQEILAEIKVDMGDTSFGDLNLSDLIIDDSWTSDIEQVEAIVEIDSSAPAIIKIKCPKEKKDKVVAFLLHSFQQSPDFEGVHLE